MATRSAHRADPTPAGAGRRLLTVAGSFVVAAIVAVAATGGTYALWSDDAEADVSTVSSGSTSLTISGSTDHDLTDLDLTSFGPGQSAVTSVVVSNTGTTPLSATVTNTTVLAQTKAMADHLTLTLTPASDCRPSLPGGITAPLSGFTTTGSPFVLDAGASIPFCLEVRMDIGAPATVQNGSAEFTMNVDAVQVRRP